MNGKAKEDPEEAGYLLLYRSPGPHNGGGLKTYDVVHAKTREAAEELEAAGWFRTLPEAFADARAPKAAATQSPPTAKTAPVAAPAPASPLLGKK